ITPVTLPSATLAPASRTSTRRPARRWSATCSAVLHRAAPRIALASQSRCASDSPQGLARSMPARRTTQRRSLFPPPARSNEPAAARQTPWIHPPRAGDDDRDHRHPHRGDCSALCLVEGLLIARLLR